MIDGAIKKFWNSVNKQKLHASTVPKLPLLFVLPYTGAHGLDVKRCVGKLLKKYYPQVGLKVVFHATFKLGICSNLKIRFLLLCLLLLCLVLMHSR